MANQSLFITRKEIATANEVTAELIRRREQELGLSLCRDKFLHSPIRYHRVEANSALKKKGLKIP